MSLIHMLNVKHCITALDEHIWSDVCQSEDVSTPVIHFGSGQNADRTAGMTANLLIQQIW